jgi:hypothetical protein
MIITKECISEEESLLKISLIPLCQRGEFPSLLQREVRRDFIINVFIFMPLLVSGLSCL